MSTDWNTLYKVRADGSLQTWAISVDFDEIIIRSGKEGGQLVESRRVCKGKNIGRSNETKNWQQALNEAEALYTKKKDKGYADSEVLARVPSVRPMLAQKFDARKDKIRYPVLVQPKLNGVRCMARFDNPDDPENFNVELISRGNKRYHVPHIEALVGKLLWNHPHLILDGELYTHGISLQEINHLVRGNPDDQWRLEYHIYDTVEPGCMDLFYSQRDPRVRIEAKAWDDDLWPVETTIAHDEDEVNFLHGDYVGRGYEGVIVRTLNGKYKFGHRSNDLLKYKRYMTTEFKIIGFYEAEGTHRGCIVFKCCTPDGAAFGVTPKLPLDTRRNMLKMAQNDSNVYIGSDLMVQHQGYSDDGVPYFPVGLAVRLPEDMD